MPRILIVDDNAGDRELATFHLDQITNLEIAYAEDGEAAMTAIQENTPDLVLTDLRMPGMDGLELVSKVREQYPLVPTILMTSFGNEQIAVEALRAGAASYVSKNSLADLLAETVGQVLAIVQANRQKLEVLSFFEYNESHFKLGNDSALFPTLLGHLTENLERLHLFDPTERNRVSLALNEALDNALYHGNLELSSELREQDMSEYFIEANKRMKREPYVGREIHVTAIESPTKVVYTVRDEGVGFNPDSLPDPTAPENMEKVAGRGLLLIRTFMDEVAFNEAGNQITMVKYNGNGNEGGGSVA